MIAIASSPHDWHSLCVKHDLEQLGHETVILNTLEISKDAAFAFTPNEPESSHWRGRDGRVIHFRDIETLWCRRLFPVALPAEVADLSDRLFMAREWNSALLGLFDAVNVRVVDRPRYAASATKPLQLVLAKHCGLRIPATLISNCKSSALAFVESQKPKNGAIHKVLTSGNPRFFQTKEWGHDEAQALDSLILAPTIIQERIAGSLEVRATIIGRQVLAAAHRPKTVDGRVDVTTTWEPHELPSHVEASLLELMDRLSLSFSTIDLRLEPDGSYCFLELNTQGQFLWIEIHTGLPLTRTMATFLAQRGVERQRSKSQTTCR